MLPWKGFTKSSFPVCHNYHCPNSHSRWNHCNNQFANLLAYVITYQSATGQPAGHVVIANGKMQIQLYHPPVWGFLCFPVTDGTIREVCESKSTISRALQHLAHTRFPASVLPFATVEPLLLQHWAPFQSPDYLCHLKPQPSEYIYLSSNSITFEVGKADFYFSYFTNDETESGEEICSKFYKVSGQKPAPISRYSESKTLRTPSCHSPY